MPQSPPPRKRDHVEKKQHLKVDQAEWWLGSKEGCKGCPEINNLRDLWQLVFKYFLDVFLPRMFGDDETIWLVFFAVGEWFTVSIFHFYHDLPEIASPTTRYSLGL